MIALTNNLLARYTLVFLLTVSTLLACSVENQSKTPVSIQDAWVRPTNPGQDVGAAYMTLTSKQDVDLVSVEADVAKNVEIHSMTMENGVMKMRMLDKLPLKAGNPYKLASGGFHFMLFDLKKPLIVGEQVNFALTFMKKNKATFRQTIQIFVQNPA